VIRLEESGRQRDGTRWQARSRPRARSGLRAGDVYDGLGLDQFEGYVWLVDGKWARCVSARELERVEEV
jgi:hypothetical protein